MTFATSPVRLSELRAGVSARLHDTHLDTVTRQRLSSLGLTERCELRLCKAGEPYIVQVRSTRIGLSKAVAEQIFVLPQVADGS